MTADPLADALLKIERADKHSEQADARINAWAATNPYDIVYEHNRGEGRILARLKVRSPMPDEIGDCVSCAVHNLRSSLDSIAWSVASRSGPPAYPKNVNFPVHESKDAFESTGAQGKIKQTGGADWAAFVATLKPYRGGNDLLYALHYASNVDKHRGIVRLWQSGGSPGSFKATGPFVQFHVGILAGPLKDGEMLVTVNDTEPYPEIHLTLRVTLREIEGISEREPAIATLKQFSGLCTGVVNAARPLFP